MRKFIRFLIAVTVTLTAAPVVGAVKTPLYAVGVVYSDNNHNGVRDPKESGLKGVRVSNGRSIVKTDEKGRYQLPVDDDTIIFVIKPRGWMTASDSNNLPKFYYIHKPNGSPKLEYKGVDPTGPLPESVDFPLYPHKEPDRFQAVVFGDPQAYIQDHVYYVAHDLIEEVAGTDAAFGVTLGDIAGNTLSLYDTMVPVMGKAGIPWYNVKGNHDTNYDGASNPKLADETFERVFGPSHYSYDYGPVHFIVLNNPYFADSKKYITQLDMEQMAFLRSDLAMIPQDQLVVLMMHIPLIQMKDKQAIFQLLETHPNTFSMSAHTHTQRNCFIDKKDGWNGAKPHHHLINAASCGCWWGGTADEVGIPNALMADGTPNGYSIVTFDGNRYSVRYKVARHPADYQMNIFTPEEAASADAEKTEVLVNVFAGSERSRVEMQIDGKGSWLAMERVEMEDPYLLSLRKSQSQSGLPDPKKSTHMWKAYLPKDISAGTHLINVRTVDMFGQVFTGRRVIRIVAK